jgi:hypothetical protein
MRSRPCLPWQPSQRRVLQTMNHEADILLLIQPHGALAAQASQASARCSEVFADSISRFLILVLTNTWLYGVRML